jgi:hypothetical protein
MIDDAGTAGANERRRRLTFVERCLVLNICPARAHFLAACSKTNLARTDPTAGVYVPYDDNVQLREAARLGINAQDTATMMGYTVTEVLSRGIIFPRKTTHPPPDGGRTHNLLLPEPLNK